MPDLSEFEGQVRQEVEAALFHAVLRRFRDVRPAAALVMTTHGPRAKTYTAACPVDPRHRLVITQIDGGALYTCAECAASASRHERLGDLLEVVTGYPRV